LIYPIVKSEKLFFLNKRSAWLSAFLGNLFTVPFVLIVRKNKLITPNALSLMSLSIFFTSALYFLVDPSKSLICSLGFFLSYLLDSSDGNLARIRGIKTIFGGLLDAIIDLLCHTIGLIIVAVAICLKINSILPIFIMLPYIYYLGFTHIKDIENLIYPNDSINNNRKESKWRKFCYKNGLSTYIYNDWEVIYICILGFAINMQEPILFLIISIYINLLIKIWISINKK